MKKYTNTKRNRKRGRYTRRARINTHNGYNRGQLLTSKAVKINAPNNRAKQRVVVEGDTYLSYYRTDVSQKFFYIGVGTAGNIPRDSVMDLTTISGVNTQVAAEMLKYKDIYKAWRMQYATLEFIPQRKPMGGDVAPAFYVKWQNTQDPMTQAQAMNQEPIIMMTANTHRTLKRQYPGLGQQWSYADSELENKWQILDGSADFTENLGYLKFWNNAVAYFDDEGQSIQVMQIHLKIVYLLTGDTAQVAPVRAVPRKQNLRPNQVRQGALDRARNAARIGAGIGLNIAGRSISNPTGRRIVNQISRAILSSDL